MANYKVTDTELTSIANAIRTKGGTQAQLEFPQGFIDAINAISGGGGGGGAIVSWASGSDADVAAMIDAAHAGTIDLQQDGGWAVGDVRTIHIDAFTGGGNTSHAAQDIDIVISSFDEYMSCGNVLQFDFKDALATRQRIHDVPYSNSEMKVTTLPALVSALPYWLSSRLMSFSVLASSGGNNPTLETVTNNKLALRALVEVTGDASFCVPGEGTQPVYYTTSANCSKKIGHNGTVNYWWTRSQRIQRNEYYAIKSFGAKQTNGYDTAYGLAPFGCL